MTALTPAEYGRHLASVVTISDEQAMEFARILLTDGQVAA